MNTSIIIKLYCKHRLQIQDLKSVFTARTVHTPSRCVYFEPRRIYSVLGDCTASSKRFHSIAGD